LLRDEGNEHLIDEDDEDDVGDMAVSVTEGIDIQDDHDQNGDLVSLVASPRLLQNCEKPADNLMEDIDEGNKLVAEILSRSSSVPAAEDSVGRRSSTTSGCCTTALSEHPDITDAEGVEAALLKIVEKLSEERLEQLLRTRGYVKPKTQPAKPKKAVQGSGPLLPCRESGCPKIFARPCELK
jgi:hypothetical protein